MSDRIIAIRQSNLTQEECMDSMGYPYNCIGTDYYHIDDIVRFVLIESEDDQANPDNFPENIEKHFWVHEGENDEDDWMACGQLTNGSYFLFTGGCGYTGFEAAGGMTLWISRSWANLVNHAMSESIYNQYIEETT